MMAWYVLVAASVRAAEGISKAPGTRTTRMSFSFAPQRKRPSKALCSNRSVIKELKRATTTPKRFPEALNLPSSAVTGIFGGASDSAAGDLSLIFSVTPSPRRKFGQIRENPRRKLLPLELRRPLLQKCSDPFLLIFAGAAHSKQHRLQIQRVGQIHLQALVH